MATLSVEKFLEFVRLSGLVDEELAQRTWQEALAAASPEQAESADYAAAKFVEAGLITRWQCDKLLQGKHKGFFLGKYKLLGHLGTGGMSSVFLAEHVAMHRRAAIKVLPASRVDDSSYLARFYLEARAAASLDHPNIIRVYDIDHEGQNHFLAMEYVEGRDLQHIVKDDGPLPYDLAATYMLQAASGLQHAHERNLVHRDIKPANLLVDNRGTVKVLDMGLAKFDNDKMSSLTIAHDENVLGTADYLAPEQALNSHTVDSRADLYSLGCTMYFLLTGHPPFPDGTLTQRLMMHQTKTAPSIYNDRPNAPPALVDLCMRMMSKTPGDRPAKSADVVKELEAYLAVAATRGGGGDGGSGFRPRRANLPGEGSGVRRVRRSPGLEDTVHDRNRDTMKGPPKAAPLSNEPGKTSSRGVLKVAKSLEEENPLAFIAEDRANRGRADSDKSSGGTPAVAKPTSGSSKILKAKELSPKGSTPTAVPIAAVTSVKPVTPVASVKPAEAPSSLESLLNESLLGMGGLDGPADPLELAAAAIPRAPLGAVTQATRKAPRRNSSQLPQWMWLVVIGVMFVSLVLMVYMLHSILQNEANNPKPAAAPAKGERGMRD
jgi:serine/threonine-protein kinase